MSNSPHHDGFSKADPDLSLIEQETAKAGVDEDPLAGNQRAFSGTRHVAVAALCVAYSVFHLMVMNVYPLETWAYRLSHVGGGLFLGFLLFGASTMSNDTPSTQRNPFPFILLVLAGLGIAYGAIGVMAIWINGKFLGATLPPVWAMSTFGVPLTAGTALAILHGWLSPQRDRTRFSWGDILLAIAALCATAYLIFFARQLQLRAGMPMALPGTCGQPSPECC